MPENDPEPLLLTEHEILALLTLNDTEPARRSRTVLHLPEVDDESDYMRAGITTLLVRGHATVEEDNVSAQGVARSVASVLTTAGEWLEIGIVTNEHSHVYFAAASAVGNVLASMNRLGVHELLPLDPRTELLDVGMGIARNALTDEGTEKPVAVNITRHGAEQDSVTASMLADSDGRWHLAAEPRNEQGELAKSEVPADEAVGKLNDALTFASS
ncbi:hypothetical protein [Arthrobacter castelli]|uniref:hypothetical protein n=1 Tax=Arthrobacter castelli TaxID=271431 RepID=UPI00040C8389|nr:hypothetical protein [Arthrobacter castelli]